MWGGSMLNWLWGFMIIIGIVYALITGNIESVTQGAFVSAKEAVTLCITMFGIMSFWCGLMEIAEKIRTYRQVQIHDRASYKMAVSGGSKQLQSIWLYSYQYDI